MKKGPSDELGFFGVGTGNPQPHQNPEPEPEPNPEPEPDPHPEPNPETRSRTRTLGGVLVGSKRLMVCGVVLMAIPGEAAMSLEQLRQAVPGLAGLVGFLLFPTFGAWLRVMVQYMEWNRPGIGRPKRISGMSVLRAVGFTVGLAFFALTLIRAASELRDVQAEAPVVGPSIQGAIVGACFWAIYAVALSALRAEWRRSRNEQRHGRALR